MSSECNQAMSEEDSSSKKPFRLLDLPPELRNKIYMHIAPEAFLRPANKGRIASRSALLRASRQLREEFLAHLCFAADIVAHVDDFNFGHVITFFNKLSTSELNSLPKSVAGEAARQRRMIVVLTVYNVNDLTNAIPNLRRWLNRTQCSTKKGVQTDISYLVNRHDLEMAEFLRQRSKRVQAEGGRKLAELEKILAALEKGKPVKTRWRHMRFGHGWNRTAF